MPFWVRCILMLWVDMFVIQIWVAIYREEILERTRRVRLGAGKLPWYLYIYGILVILTVFSIIPFGIWLIFLR